MPGITTHVESASNMSRSFLNLWCICQWCLASGSGMQTPGCPFDQRWTRCSLVWQRTLGPSGTGQATCPIGRAQEKVCCYLTKKQKSQGVQVFASVASCCRSGVNLEHVCVVGFNCQLPIVYLNWGVPSLVLQLASQMQGPQLKLWSDTFNRLTLSYVPMNILAELFSTENFNW